MVSQPTRPDHSSYPDFVIPGVTPADFRLGGDELPSEAIAKVHEPFLAYLSETSTTFLGYQLDAGAEFKRGLKGLPRLPHK